MGTGPLANAYDPMAQRNANALLNDKPISQQPQQNISIPRQGVTKPVDLTSGSSQSADSGTNTVNPTPWSLEGDPLYQQALAQGQSQFNSSRNQAMYNLNDVTTQANQDRQALDQNSAEARRRLAGNYAARGMAGGGAGALTLAEAEQNAKQIAAQTSLKDKLAALNANFLENYGNAQAAGYDWTGTLAGQQYKTQAAQTALTSQLAQYGVA